jgi:hypothetical protein
LSTHSPANDFRSSDLSGYHANYHGSRTHLSLAKNTPTTRRVQGIAEGDVIAFRDVGGLHHRYERRVA